MLDTPGAFIGEFDALDGPKVTYAFEYFDYSRVATSTTTLRQLLSFVEGEVLLGKCVASGFLHRECREYLDSVAAHVLVSNESREERLLYQDSGCPCVGSFLFSVPDIVARGEKRRFCLIFLHPSYHELVARWDYLSTFVAVLLKRWLQRATARYQSEYDTLKNLEQLREESRRKPLRPLIQLLSDPSADANAEFITNSLASSSVFEDLHCCFEIVLPQVFTQPIPLTRIEQDAAHQEAEKLLDERLLLAQSSIDHVNVDLADLPEDDVVLPRFAKQIVFVDSEIVVKPLPVWLLEYLSDSVKESDASVESYLAVHVLLRALFSGNQIVITGDDARDCASLGMALSYMVPPPLMKVHVGSNRYRMPYESRVLSFSQHVLADHVFAETPAAAECARASPVVKLFDMEADGIVHVRVADGRIDGIQECDQLRRTAQGSQGGDAAGHTGAAQPTTLENRILTLLKPYVVPIAGGCAISVVSLQLITTQFHQLVSEYVVRGRVYLQLFAKQEVESNSLSLSPAVGPDRGGHGSAPSATDRSPARSQRTSDSVMSSRASSHRGGALQSLAQQAPQSSQTGAQESSGSRSANAAQLSPHGGEGERILKHTHLSPVYGRQFQHNHYVFSSFAPEDHHVLVFLGSA